MKYCKGTFFLVILLNFPLKMETSLIIVTDIHTTDKNKQTQIAEQRKNGRCSDWFDVILLPLVMNSLLSWTDHT